MSATLAASVLLAFFFLAPVAAAQPLESVDLAFQSNVIQYVELRDQLRQGVAREHIIDPHIREVGGPLLAARIRQARVNAAPADIIPVAFAEILRDRLHKALDPTEVDVLLMNLYTHGLPGIMPEVNMHYADAVAVVPPASVLSALPPVPGVLGYRLIGCDVVLWDEEAQIVVDVVLNALPEPRIWKFLEVSSFDLRRLIHQALNQARLDPGQLVDDIVCDMDPKAAAPVVDQRFDWNCGAAMPPSVLHALPPLPRPLEYRFVRSDLVVIDIDSGYVRGILPNVLPRYAPRSRT